MQWQKTFHVPFIAKVCGGYRPIKERVGQIWDMKSEMAVLISLQARLAAKKTPGQQLRRPEVMDGSGEGIRTPDTRIMSPLL